MGWCLIFIFSLHLLVNVTPFTVHRAADITRHTKNKRYIVLDPSLPNTKYFACNTTAGRAGYCKHRQYCYVDRVTEDNFLTNHQDACNISATVEGICCPQTREGFDSQGSNVVYHLPSTGDNAAQNIVESISSTRDFINTGCGVSTRKNSKPRSSDEPSHEEWPWMAALMRGDVFPTCGAVLISERHVLTAAHCVDALVPTDLQVRLGEYDLHDKNETRHKNFNVSQIIMHEEYDEETFDNDIAILTLLHATAFDSYIWPICLPPVGRDFVNETAYVIGWGTQFETGRQSQRLKEVAVPVWSREECQAAVQSTSISDVVLCAAGREGFKDACQSDSGGPLMLQLANGRWVNIGIVSWGDTCGQMGSPGMYARVNRHLKWIRNNILF